MKTLNDYVAVAPIELGHDKGESKRIVAGFSGTDRTMRTIISSKVVFDSKQFKAGQTIYFKAEISKLTTFSERHRLSDDGVEFILLPENLTVGVSDN